jgi:uncharacterized repeat protein (TIGR04076 family)
MDNSEKMQTSVPKRHNNSDETIFFATLEWLLCRFLMEILLNGCRKFCNFAQNPPPMKRIKITVMRMACYDDLMARYENPIEHACDMRLGQTFLVENCERPATMCESAWQTLEPFVRELAEGGGNFFDGWMRNPHSAMLSCNDGFRPVSFYVEVVE